MTLDITVAIPAIPPRVGNLLDMATASVAEQTEPPKGGISCALDVNREGAAITRQRALDAVRTPWVAFLDDDDKLYPNHLYILSNLVSDNNADYAYAWFDGNNPFPMHRGRQFDPQQPHHTTMTVLVRTELAKEAGFLLPDGPLHQDWMGEDWQFTLRCAQLGGKFVGTGEITWHYRVHAKNTSGLPTRW
ncbi:MAG: glycosyltransferase family 2 protein [Nitrososphaera sp.]